MLIHFYKIGVLIFNNTNDAVKNNYKVRLLTSPGVEMSSNVVKVFTFPE